MKLDLVFGVLALLFLLYTPLAIYLSAVLPDENGVRDAPWFFVSPSFWTPRSHKRDAIHTQMRDGAPAPRVEDGDVAAEAAKMKVRRRRRTRVLLFVLRTKNFAARHAWLSRRASRRGTLSASCSLWRALLAKEGGQDRDGERGACRASSQRVAVRLRRTAPRWSSTACSGASAAKRASRSFGPSPAPGSRSLPSSSSASSAPTAPARPLATCSRAPPHIPNALIGRNAETRKKENGNLRAGKSTTINILTGVLPPSGGDAIVHGESVRSAGGMAEIRAIMGVCPQFDVLWAELTGLEHMIIFGHMKGLSGKGAVRLEAEQLLSEARPSCCLVPCVL